MDLSYVKLVYLDFLCLSQGKKVASFVNLPQKWAPFHSVQMLSGFTSEHQAMAFSGVSARLLLDQEAYIMPTVSRELNIGPPKSTIQF